MERVSRVLPFTDSSGKMSFRIMFSYIFDYAIIIGLAIAYAAIDKIVSPFSQRFSVNDITIQYPFTTKERIPIMEAVLISGGFPIVVIIIYTLVLDGLFSHSGSRGFKKYSFKQRLWELNCGILGLLLAQGSAFCITGTLKNLIGRPRPDLLSRCQADPATLAAQIPFQLSTRAICPQPDVHIMQDAFRSFPSGHSSASFAGLGYLSLYLAGKLHVLDQRGEVWRTVIIVIPLVAASCIAASRIMDYRHHPQDVLIGSALGLLCAWASYRQYFPPLSDVWMKGRAYPMREWGVAMKKPEDVYGVGYSSGRGERAGNVTGRHGLAQEIPYQGQYPTQRQDEYAMGSMRAPDQSSIPTSRYVPGSKSQSPVDETDYDVIRSKNQIGTSAQGVPQSGEQWTNVFREQIVKNHQQRGPGEGVSDDEEEDLGAGNRTLLVGPGRV